MTIEEYERIRTELNDYLNYYVDNFKYIHTIKTFTNDTMLFVCRLTDYSRDLFVTFLLVQNLSGEYRLSHDATYMTDTKNLIKDYDYDKLMTQKFEFLQDMYSILVKSLSHIE